MSQSQATYPSAQVSSVKMLRAMVGIGILCALLIVSTYEITKPNIARNKATALEKAIFNVLPGIREKETFLLNDKGEFVKARGEEKGADIIYAGYDEEGQLLGFVIEASGQGYADIIRILYGYDPFEERIVGMHVLESKETPGLGDKIEKDEAFKANFSGLDVSLNEAGDALAHPVITVKSGEKANPWEIDGITGATISSRAIGDIIAGSTAKWLPLIKDQMDTFKKEKGKRKHPN